MLESCTWAAREVSGVSAPGRLTPATVEEQIIFDQVAQHLLSQAHYAQSYFDDARKRVKGFQSVPRSGNTGNMICIASRLSSEIVRDFEPKDYERRLFVIAEHMGLSTAVLTSLGRGLDVARAQGRLDEVPNSL